MKRLTTRHNDQGIGIDVGWWFPDPDSNVTDEVTYWGNTQDVNTLASLIDDLYFKGFEFQLDGYTVELLSAPWRRWPCVAFEEGLV